MCVCFFFQAGWQVKQLNFEMKSDIATPIKLEIKKLSPVELQIRKLASCSSSGKFVLIALLHVL